MAKIFDYSELSWDNLLDKVKDWFDAPRVVLEGFKRLKALVDNLTITVDNIESNSIQSISGDLVDNTDPQNPVINDPRPYKVYTALLTQTGTDAPVATVLENTLGNVVWSYATEGVYLATLNNMFVDGKTYTCFSNGNMNNYIGYAFRQDIDSISIETYSLTGSAPIDGALIGASIEIRVYN